MWRTVSQKKRTHRAPGKHPKLATVAVITSQHLLLWSSIYVLTTTIYILSRGETGGSVLISDGLLILTAVISISYIICHCAACYLRCATQSEQRDIARLRVQKLSHFLLRGSVTSWLIACGMVITFTIARHPSCVTRGDSISSVDVGILCILQRCSVAASLLAFLMSSILFVLTSKMQEPFRYHLVGTTTDRTILPLTLPYKPSMVERSFSDMSFKCRSSTSISSHTLVPSLSDSTSALLAYKPEKDGVVINTPKSSMPSFLAPRPSLSSIRSYARMDSLPSPSSLMPPIPPLPPYFPHTYHPGSTIYAAIHPPCRPPRPDSIHRQRIVRIVPPSPALSIENLARFNNSQESLSSVYSQSTDGQRYSILLQGPLPPMTESSRSYSSGSGGTLKKSPLAVMRLAQNPDVIVPDWRDRRIPSDSTSDSDINDAATLQARLPSVKAVSHFGDVEKWACGSLGPATDCQRLPHQLDDTGMRKGVGFKSLVVRKTRESETSRWHGRVTTIGV